VSSTNIACIENLELSALRWAISGTILVHVRIVCRRWARARAPSGVAACVVAAAYAALIAMRVAGAWDGINIDREQYKKKE
jgi:hypothetical protein